MISTTAATTTTTTVSPATTAESLLMSFLGDFMPYLAGDKDSKSSDVQNEKNKVVDNVIMKRKGLAFDVRDLESKR